MDYSYFGIGEVAPRASHFPDPLVGRIPHRFDEDEQIALQLPASLAWLETCPAGQVQASMNSP
jgi:hypothetical protein